MTIAMTTTAATVSRLMYFMCAVYTRGRDSGASAALFSGWEWTVHPGGKNLHRVVFTSANGPTAKKFLPFTANDSQRLEDLWQWLEKTKTDTGADFVAIPHNPNLSGGLMFDMVDSAGRPITAEYARMRIRWEPVIEMTQVKGTSEVHPELSPNDEFAEFEIRRKLLAGAATPSSKADYARSALLRSLEIEQKTGANPYKFGMIGASDSHTGLSSVEENDFLGKLARQPMGGDLTSAPRGKAPTFLIHAVKDPISANLDRVQVVKGWLELKFTIAVGVTLPSEAPQPVSLRPFRAARSSVTTRNWSQTSKTTRFP